VAGAGAHPLHLLGDADDLHRWVLDPDEVDTEVLERATARSRAVVMGRPLFDVIDGPAGWSADMGHGRRDHGRWDVVAQAIEAGLAEALHLHIAPMIVAAGTPLFRAGMRRQ
jgi:dihydrofolate reductase